MKKMILVLMALTLMAPMALANSMNWDSAGDDIKSGVTNIFTGWLEVPATIKEYHNSSDQKAGLREISGFFDGALQGLERTGKGIWNTVFALIPGDQSLDMIPETMFSDK